MKSVTIPKALTKGSDLVVISREEYNELTRSAKEGQSQLDRDIAESLKDYRAGRYHGPFSTAAEAIKFLKDRRKTVRR